MWFLQQRSKGAPVSGPLIQQEALQLYPEFTLTLKNRSYSSGWLYRFVQRHGIRAILLRGCLCS